MGNELSALIKVMLDYSNINGDMSKIQKVLEKYTMNITPELDTKKTVSSVKKVLPQIISELRKIPGVDIPIDMKFSDKLIRKSLKQVIQEGKKAESELAAIGRPSKEPDKMGNSFFDRFKNTGANHRQLLSMNSSAKLLVSHAKEALITLKEVDSLLTGIGKENAKLSKSDLVKMGDTSFEIASKYGKKATDYLSGIQEASRAGYENTAEIAELSMAAQGAGNLTAVLANQYIAAMDKAYKMNGSIEALTKTLDGANNITNNNAVNMVELAEAMSVVGTQAASSQMEINEATAATAALIAVTKQSGSQMGNAFKGILMNLRQVTGKIDGEEIDTESLARYKKACEELGVSLSEVRNGAVQLKEPMQILKELSGKYTKLDESDAKRANLLSAVGGEYSANALNAILENYSLYEEMLKDYAAGAGSMAMEAEKTADSWEGSLNRLSNTWTDTVGNIVNSDTVTFAINGLNQLLSVINAITDALGSTMTIGLGAGAFGIVEFLKNLPYQKVLKIAWIFKLG